MTKISITLLSLLSLTSLAVAGDSKADKAAAAKAVEPPKKMEMPKAPAEIGERVKAMSGTWTCTGTGAGMDGKDLKFTGTMKSKADLDGFWAHDSFDGAMGEGKSSMKFKFESFSTFDATSKKWRTMFMDSFGGQMVGTGDAMKDGKMDTMSDAMDSRGKSEFKDHVDMSDKKGAHMWGEESRDNGRTWNKVYDMMCKK